MSIPRIQLSMSLVFVFVTFGAEAATYSLALPTPLTSEPAIGRPSYPAAVTDYGQGTFAFPAESFTDDDYRSATTPAATTKTLQIFPTTHLDDTNVAAAWAAGWTGKGTNVTVIDDFQTGVISLPTTINVTRNKTAYDSFYGTYIGSYSVDYSWANATSHGNVVTNILGGDFDGQLVSGTLKLSYGSIGNLLSCSSATPGSGGTTYMKSCAGKFYNSYAYILSTYFPNSTETLSYHKMAGLAKEAFVTNDSINLSSTQSLVQTLTYMQGHLANSSSADVINLSLGMDIQTTGKTFDQVMAIVAGLQAPSKVNGVVVVAAGNGSSPCATQDLSGCNAVAVAAAFQDATKDSTIIAGALDGTGSGENIATYSTRAGILADRFLLAPGTSGYSGVVGTSFAAPRIAGAAAIVKQKFPNLSAKQIADILLLSANKDISNSGAPNFSGVHSVYGHGKLDLKRALRLAGLTSGLDASAAVPPAIKPLVIDPAYYSSANPDVAGSLGNDTTKLLAHWQTDGAREGRQASPIYDPQYYATANPDVTAAFGSDFVALMNHWANSGLKEGRRASRVFDPKYYLTANSDLGAGFGSDYVALANHWLTNGIKEGRVSASNWDPKAYLAANPDLSKSLGTNYAAATMHYLLHGFAEGRPTAPAPDVSPPTTPKGLTAVAESGTKITLTWSAATDAVGVTTYNIYRGGALLATAGNVTTYSDTTVAASTTYTYTVAACDAARNCSAQSTSTSATTPQSTATNTNQKSDCLFNWAEANYDFLFAPKGTQSKTLGPYYLRYYTQTTSYLEVNSTNLFYLGPLSGNTLLDLGSVATWYKESGCQ